jgi:hypothetical protein
MKPPGPPGPRKIRTKKVKIDKTTSFLVPHDENGYVAWEMPKKLSTGDLPTHFLPRWGYNRAEPRKPIFWKENTPFKAGLKFHNIIRTKSSVRFAVQNTETNVLYYFRENDFLELMSKTAWVFGICVGEWQYKQRGGYISIVPVE